MSRKHGNCISAGHTGEDSGGDGAGEKLSAGGGGGGGAGMTGTSRTSGA